MKIFYFLLFCSISFVQLHAVITPESLRAAADYSGARHGYSLLVMQHGKVILEDYQNGSTEQTTHKIYSGTKSFWVVAVLAAVNDGILTLDERVSDTIPAWRSDLLKRNITVRQIMNFTDGIDPAFKLHGETIPNRNAYAIHVPLVAKPGTAFIYGPSHGQVMAELLRRKLEPKNITPFAYLERKVLYPLGLGPVEHKEDLAGNPLVATGFKLTAREWLQFGVLLLHNGTYGKKEIVPANLLEECFHGTTPNPAFGMGLWLNSEASSPGTRERDVEDMLEKKWQEQDWANVCICRAAPADMVVALGSGYQRLYVIPSLDLIIVRQGENAKFSDAVFLRTLLDH
jgi:CubicO group peptidase (beta-lactamase class C family)